MAESVTHRFSEYLRNNSQSNEDMSIPNAIYDVSQDGAQHGKTIETEGYRNQERRSSITRYDVRRLFLDLFKTNNKQKL